jgi:hypothetical protein
MMSPEMMQTSLVNEKRQVAKNIIVMNGLNA